MKKAAIAILAAVCMISAAVPLIAAEPQDTTRTDQMSQKDQCLLYSRQCVSTADSIQTRMKKLDTEIKKGTRVYTPQELKRLQDKLNELNNLLDDMTTNP